MSSAGIPVQQDLHVLYNTHHGWLYDWLRRRLGSAADAADLAHDTFLRLILKPVASEFSNAAQARCYLRTTASNLCVDLWRRRSIEQAWLDVLAARPEPVMPSAEHQVMVLQALNEIDAMLRNLPLNAARAFSMAIGCEMSSEEVAQELGVSTRMVRKYVAQAMLHCLRLEARQFVEA